MGWLGYAALSAVLAGLVAIFGKRAVRGIDTTARSSSVMRCGSRPSTGSVERSRWSWRCCSSAERAPLGAWLGTALMVVGAVIVARS
jgi:uncharacterized membrane protein